MLRTKAVYLKNIYGLEKWDSISLVRRFTKQFDNNNNFGFIDTHIHKDTIISTLVYKTISIQQIFDSRQNTFISQELPNYFSVPFQIDLKNNILRSDSGGKKIQKLVSVIGVVLDFKISIDDIFVDLSKFIQRVEQSSVSFEVTNFILENYIPETGLSGKFVATVLEQEVAKNILATDEFDVTQLNLEVIIDGLPITWRLSSVGSLAVRADENDIAMGLDLLEKMVRECRYA